MGASGFGPAPHNNLDESSVRWTGPNDAPRITQSPSRLPDSPLSRCARSGEPLDVGSSSQSQPTHNDETSIVNAEDPQELDVDDFRR
jgi:hypothetical protein